MYEKFEILHLSEILTVRMVFTELEFLLLCSSLFFFSMKRETNAKRGKLNELEICTLNQAYFEKVI